MMYAVFLADTGALVSSGTRVADPLPAGRAARQLSEQESEWLRAGGAWDAAARVVAEPPTPAPNALDDATAEYQAEIARLQAVIDSLRREVLEQRREIAGLREERRAILGADRPQVDARLAN